MPEWSNTADFQFVVLWQVSQSLPDAICVAGFFVVRGPLLVAVEPLWQVKQVVTVNSWWSNANAGMKDVVL